jgi:hypothetical protein
LIARKGEVWNSKLWLKEGMCEIYWGNLLPTQQYSIKLGLYICGRHAGELENMMK